MKDKLLIWLWRHSRKILLWSLWLLLITVLGLYFFNRLTGENRTLFLPGKTSHGHYQIEIACNSCHTKNSEVIKQQACLDCHKEKKYADTKKNSHRAKLFEADEKAEQRDIIRADRCVTCHKEHQLGQDKPGVTQPADFCVLCHKDVADDRPSHKDLAFDECDDCHNYHDNSANYGESFIAKHLNDEADTLTYSKIPVSNLLKRYKKKHPAEPLIWSQKDTPEIADITAALDWEGSSHALIGINCRSCHSKKKQQWVDRPDHSFCSSCHKSEITSFLSGKHGIRTGQDLSPMTSAKARLPMKKNDRELSCNACHLGHRFNTRYAAVEACLRCHDDKHSQSYKSSKHFRLWLNQDPTGVSCATCHMPKLKKGKKIWVQHNQNDNLRPNQKMIKNVCVKCHGLGFSFDTLQDDSLIANNFSTSPVKHIPVLEMWQKKLNQKQ